ncbi:MAG: SAF domain-containing protein [Actinomycetota bacterium]
MSRRARAAVFLLLAVGCAALAAAVANGYGSSVAGSFGPLRSVVVASRDLPAGRPIDPAALTRALQLRRVPERFVPPDALGDPQQALGQEPAAMVPAGSYLLAAQLRLPKPADAGAAPGLVGGRSPVEIAVTGAEALLAGGSPEGRRMDVVVTTEPGGPGPGRTYVAASSVRLLSLREVQPSGPGPSAGWSATLALTRRQALRLIQAESFARQVRLLPRPGG